MNPSLAAPFSGQEQHYAPPQQPPTESTLSLTPCRKPVADQPESDVPPADKTTTIKRKAKRTRKLFPVETRFDPALATAANKTKQTPVVAPANTPEPVTSPAPTMPKPPTKIRSRRIYHEGRPALLSMLTNRIDVAELAALHRVSLQHNISEFDAAELAIMVFNRLPYKESVQIATQDRELPDAAKTS